MSQDLTALYLLNSHTLRLRGLKNLATGLPINGGVTVSAKVCARGTTTAVTNGTIASLSNVGGSDGDWVGTFPNTVGVVRGSRYDVLVTVDGGAMLTGQWKIECEVIERIV